MGAGMLKARWLAVGVVVLGLAVLPALGAEPRATSGEVSVVGGTTLTSDTIEYYLDPSEHYKTTTLHLAALGPRVPTPNAPVAAPVDHKKLEELTKTGKSS